MFLQEIQDVLTNFTILYQHTCVCKERECFPLHLLCIPCILSGAAIDSIWTFSLSAAYRFRSSEVALPSLGMRPTDSYYRESPTSCHLAAFFKQVKCFMS